jgi:hypothetical protein
MAQVLKLPDLDHQTEQILIDAYSKYPRFARVPKKDLNALGDGTGLDEEQLSLWWNAR